MVNVFIKFVLLDCKSNVFNLNGNVFPPLVTYLYEYLTITVSKNSF